MDTILEKCPGCTGIADDVAVYGRTEKEHDDNLMNLMKVAQENGLIFNSGKCIIKSHEIPLFGLLYTADGVKPDPDRVVAISGLSTPQNTKELQEFLGIATYMASFVPCLSHHSAVLRELLKRVCLVASTCRSVLHQQVVNMQDNSGLLRYKQGQCTAGGQFAERLRSSPHAGLASDRICQCIAY